MVDESEVFESFLNHPPLTQMQNPLEAERIQQFQFTGVELEAQRQRQPHRFPIKVNQGLPLVCYRTHPTDLVGDWKTALPTGPINDVIQWYHRSLGHCGIVRMYDTIRAHCYHPQLKHRIEAFNCDACQRHKLLGARYGELPPREAPLLPWDEVAADLIGAWKVEVLQGQEIEFNALTSIDPVTNLVKMI
jgi:hypothetical protein